jgi:hypothetical protein
MPEFPAGATDEQKGEIIYRCDAAQVAAMSELEPICDMGLTAGWLAPGTVI